MCGISAAISLYLRPIGDLKPRLEAMNRLQAHRGPDGEGTWIHPKRHVGFGHRRLSIIDLVTGAQPMGDPGGNWVTYNGEIYNYVELRSELGGGELGADPFTTTSDTEVLLTAYRRWGQECVHQFQGMFAFALWDEAHQELFCARDPFGIKPFYYAVVDDVFYCASEAKALLPFLPSIETDVDGLRDYLAFQFCLGGKTLFRGVQELLPGHTLTIRNGRVHISRYWQVFYDLDWTHTSRYFEERIAELLDQSVRLHLRADVPTGSYVSGGFDSSAVAVTAAQHDRNLLGFHGKFSAGPEYDESRYARAVAQHGHFNLLEADITASDFIDHVAKVIYHLDYPMAGPGSFPQYMVARLTGQHRKVVLGGQGGDEMFGGYARYLIAYFEQCIRSAIDGTMHNGNFIVTYESIIPQLATLRQYKPMLQHFWQQGLFEDIGRRYFRLIERASLADREIRWEAMGDYSPYDTFHTIFYGDNVRKESYFDLMTHFDFKTLLPALLHVEDRMSMAHGVETRVPLLYRPLVELAATIPANIKFSDGRLKHVLRQAMQSKLPQQVVQRGDKMGFPVPLSEWADGEARDFIHDLFSSQRAKERPLIDYTCALERLGTEPRFGRKVWGLLSLELWHRQFHDRSSEFQGMIPDTTRSV